MSQQNFQEMLDRARKLENAGQSGEAAAICQDILASKPDHLEALHLYSLIAGNNKNWDLAISLLQRGIASAPNLAFLHAVLGLAYRYSGRTQEAINAYKRAIELDPNSIQTLISYASLLRECGQFDEAILVYEKIMKFNKDIPEVHFGIGSVYLSQSLHQKAIDAYLLALRLKPDYLDAMNGLGVAQMHLGLKKEAYNTFLRVLATSPNSLTALNNLGILDEESCDYCKAYDRFSLAANYEPKDIETLNNISHISLLMHSPEKAHEAVRAALKLDPLNLKALRNLASVHALSGDMDSSIATLKKLLSICPQESEAHSNMIFTMHYVPNIDPKAILDECTVWSKNFENPILSHNVALRRNAEPGRKLRVGFVSPDFSHHPVGRSLLQLFTHHDNSQYDAYCYSNSIISDHVTEELQNHTDEWHNIKWLSDSDVAILIRKDQIDILVDLSLHSASNRLLIFAHKPAPIQMSYLGYPCTTGMKSMDYRISDRFIDPEDETSKLYSEETLYITSYWCYLEPYLRIPIFVSDLPTLKNGFITFGCLNNIYKISNTAIQCWSQILIETPNSKLMLYCPQGQPRDALIEKFCRNGVDKSRIKLLAWQSFPKYFESYHEIDIALDPFPFGGGITSCDATWLGLPVVSLRGKTAVGRGGASILSNIGLHGLIANSEEEYISIAKNLCSDLEGLAAIRKGLRERLQQSPVMDGKQFADEMGHIFRQAWIRHCGLEK
jgi:predicted O-linked N-acetylglucosamine transferase (SPINDLY family)